MVTMAAVMRNERQRDRTDGRIMGVGDLGNGAKNGGLDFKVGRFISRVVGFLGVPERGGWAG
jgi:hypothetical protein